MTNSGSFIRRLLRRAERALKDPKEQAALEQEGVSIGDWETVDKEQLLRELEQEDPDAQPTVNVTVYLDEGVADRDAFEVPLSEHLEASGIGAWVGSGQGSIGERPFFDVTFTVKNLAVAVASIRAKLLELKAGPSTVIYSSDGGEYHLSGSGS